MPALSARSLKVAFVTSEVYPFSKTGGLAHVSQTLPLVLKNRGHDIRIFTPHYRRSRIFSTNKITGNIAVPLGDQIESGQLIETFVPETSVPVILINHNLFDRRGIYGERNKDYSDNARRFIFLCRATLEALKSLNFKPDILHLNDWHTGLIAPMLQGPYKEDWFFRNTALVYTIHNLEFRGIFDRETLALAHLGPEHFTPERLEFHGQVSFAKGGLAYAHKINTVSPTYRNETLTPEFGFELDGLLRLRQEDYLGILNGIDYAFRNPQTDRYLPANYGLGELSGKAICKAHLQKEFDLPQDPDVPLLGFVGRFTEQKGLNLIKESLKDLLSFPLQMVFLGAGELDSHEFFGEMHAAFPKKVGKLHRYNEKVSHRVYAGVDIFLTPSRSEPCGLAQMIAMRYGAPPLVMKTGGLADTVIDYSDRESGNGFVFREFTPGAFKKAILRVLITFADKPLWQRLQENTMKTDFSWDRSAEAYENLYLSAIEKLRR
jgi:starch synthase